MELALGTEKGQAGELRGILRDRRTQIFEHLEQQLLGDKLADVLFDLLVHLALNPDVVFSDEIVESYLWRHELESAQAVLSTHSGRRIGIKEFLAEKHVDESVEYANALLARGFARKLSPLPPSDRNAYCQRIVGLLPGLERVGPYVLTDYVDLCLSRDDARFFWQLYTERIGVELGKRGQQGDRDDVPWLLYHLMSIDLQPERIAGGNARSTLYKHLDRLLLRDRDRGRCIRLLIDCCADDLALRRLAYSPAFVEDADLLAELITRGEENHISLALYTLQIHGDLDRCVAIVLEKFREQTLPDISHRVTEVFAQVHLPQRLSRNLERLSIGLQGIVLDKLIEGDSIETLAQAISPDERSFRHCLLVASLAKSNAFGNTPSLYCAP